MIGGYNTVIGNRMQHDLKMPTDAPSLDFRESYNMYALFFFIL
jgi:hypothetical protein